MKLASVLDPKTEMIAKARTAFVADQNPSLRDERHARVRAGFSPTVWERTAEQVWEALQ